MKKILLNIVALSPSVSQSHNYVILLSEEDGGRKLPVVIGSFEAQSIAVALERMTPNRPLTHDLLKNVLDTFNAQVKEVIINNLLDGIFFSRLVCIKDGEIYEIDSRTSDAIALAVRAGCPIYTYEFILDAAGMSMEDTEEDDEEGFEMGEEVPETHTSLSTYSVEALNKLLQDVLAEEDYERAVQIRDEINRRKEGS
ncbi:MAG: bifunctional nuclease family protein [Saprospiraceae bacterium]|nr:bifunctional nuclease family protein [Saprospiraceae bacterium]